MKNDPAIEAVATSIEAYGFGFEHCGWPYLLEGREKIFDPFAGSGTVFIAAEKLQRIAFRIEIEPKNCEICLKGQEEYTRSKAVLLRKIGKPQKRASYFDSKR